MLEILNSQHGLTFTKEYCDCGDVLACSHSCDKQIPFFDCLVSVYIIETDDGNLIPHLKFITYSKPTDVHPCALLIYIMNLLGSLKELQID